MIEISKELLSEVLEREVTDFEHWDNDEYRCTAYFDGFRQRFFINIYGLAHKCKEWALSKNYILSTETNTYGGICNMGVSSMDVDVFYSIKSVTRDNTEVGAIFKACEWILNNKPL